MSDKGQIKSSILKSDCLMTVNDSISLSLTASVGIEVTILE